MFVIPTEERSDEWRDLLILKRKGPSTPPFGLRSG
jgi:hypothetical protein